MTRDRAKILWRIRSTAWIVAAVFLSALLARHGIDAFVLVSAALLVLIGLALEYIETRAPRPRKTWLRWGLAAFVLALVLIALPLYLGASLIVGVILWFGLSAAGLALCVQYERTEPL